MAQGETGTGWCRMLEPMLVVGRSAYNERIRGKTGYKPVSLMDNYPEDLEYHKEHMWVRADGTIGISFFAQDQLGEIVFIEVPEAGADIEAGEAFGEIESRKSVSDLLRACDRHAQGGQLRGAGRARDNQRGPVRQGLGRHRRGERRERDGQPSLGGRVQGTRPGKESSRIRK